MSWYVLCFWFIITHIAASQTAGYKASSLLPETFENSLTFWGKKSSLMAEQKCLLLLLLLLNCMPRAGHSDFSLVNRLTLTHKRACCEEEKKNCSNRRQRKKVRKKRPFLLEIWLFWMPYCRSIVQQVLHTMTIQSQSWLTSAQYIKVALTHYSTSLLITP